MNAWNRKGETKIVTRTIVFGFAVVAEILATPYFVGLLCIGCRQLAVTEFE